jgi:hypothetical protein
VIEYPSLDMYQAALQNPSSAFKDPDLASAWVERTPFNLPAVESGGFALTYKLIAKDGRTWAVRCFKSHIPEREEHYLAVSRFLRSCNSPYLIEVDYQRAGINCLGKRLPFTKMLWIPRDTLNLYIEKHVHDRDAIEPLADKFRKLAVSLDELGVAHGDLQHGNILVVNGALQLVDYDGMFVPGLDGERCVEVGHPNYQHPERTDPGNLNNAMSPTLDRFSTIVIYLALRALALNPTLWKRHSNGENLLFRRKDFVDPTGSALLAEIETTADLRDTVQRFRELCSGKLAEVPSLADFLQHKYAPPIPVGRHYSEVKLFEVVDASKPEQLLELRGQRLEIVGRVEKVVSSTTENGTECAFLNFGNYETGAFVVVVWSECLTDLCVEA